MQMHGVYPLEAMEQVFFLPFPFLPFPFHPPSLAPSLFPPLPAAKWPLYIQLGGLGSAPKIIIPRTHVK